MPWGTTSWGTNNVTLASQAYGGLGAGPLTVAGALATSERTVLVTLSGNALADSPLRAGDALNPASWSVYTLDSAGAPALVRRVLAVRQAAVANQFELYTLEKFPAYPTNLRVTAVGLLSADGAPATSPLAATFAGTAVREAGEKHATLRDLTNTPFSGETAAGGTLEVTSGGDYATQSGYALLRKLVIRRLTTDPDAFFHLVDGTYGLGLAVKEPIHLGNIVQARTAIERQVAREPEVAGVQCRLELASNGTLTINLRIATAAGIEVEIPLQVPNALAAT